MNSDDLRATADDLVTATNPRVVAAKAALHAAAAEVDSLRAENAELRARIETHDEMRLANHAASEMRKARAERDALRAKIEAAAGLASESVHVLYPDDFNPWRAHVLRLRAALASPAPTDHHEDDELRRRISFLLECLGIRPHKQTDDWPAMVALIGDRAPTGQTSDGPDLGGKLAVDEAQCDCHRGQPSADVYKCRYGGLHRRRASGMWHHPGDQALFPAAAVQPDEAATEETAIRRGLVPPYPEDEAATEAPTDQTSDEAKRCEHGKTEGHFHLPVPHDPHSEWCPGPADPRPVIVGREVRYDDSLS